MKKLIFFFLPLFLFGQSAELLRVIDGDTLLLKDSSAGLVICQASFIDTPEVIQNDKLTRDIKNCSNISLQSAIQAGDEAKEFAKGVLKNTKTLNYEVTRTLSNGNPVCQIALPKGLNASLNPTFSEVMVAQGYALPYVIYATQKQKESLLALSLEAKNAKRGLWKSNPALMQCLVHKRYSLKSLR